MSDQPIKVAILGQGRSGFDIHVRWLRQDSRYQIVAVADLIADYRKQAEADLGAKAYSDYKDLLKDGGNGAELIVNALPSFLHPQGTIDALNAGFHVVSEKPAARTVKDFDRMCDTAKKNKRLLLPFQNSRFKPCFQKTQEIIESGVLGELVHVRMNWGGFGRRWDWQTLQEFWGGNLLNTGPHPIDQAVCLLNGKKPKITACLKSINPYGDAENFVSVYLQTKNAPLIEILLSSFQAYPQGEMLNISGTYGGLTSNDKIVRWKYFDPATAPKHENKGTWSRREYCGEPLQWKEEVWEIEKGELSDFDTLSRKFYAHIFDILRHKAPRIISLAQVRQQVEIMEECHRQNKMPKLKKKFLK